MPHDEFVITALADQFFLAAMLEPHHRAAHAVFVDEGELVLQIRAPMQIEKFRSALRIVARERVRSDVVDFGVADPDGAAVVQRLEIVLARSQHDDLPPTRRSGSVRTMHTLSRRCAADRAAARLLQLPPSPKLSRQKCCACRCRALRRLRNRVRPVRLLQRGAPVTRRPSAQREPFMHRDAANAGECL